MGTNTSGRTGTSTSGSRRSGYGMQDRLLQRSLNDGHILVLCIETRRTSYREPSPLSSARMRVTAGLPLRAIGNHLDVRRTRCIVDHVRELSPA
jgi:hypothetical protein